MGIITESEAGDMGVVGCFYCGKRFYLTEEMIFREGADSKIFMHQQCAGQLGAELIRDAAVMKRQKSKLKHERQKADKYLNFSRKIETRH